jgi:hypothetical protein
MSTILFLSEIFLKRIEPFYIITWRKMSRELWQTREAKMPFGTSWEIALASVRANSLSADDTAAAFLNLNNSSNVHHEVGDNNNNNNNNCMDGGGGDDKKGDKTDNEEDDEEGGIKKGTKIDKRSNKTNKKGDKTDNEEDDEEGDAKKGTKIDKRSNKTNKKDDKTDNEEDDEEGDVKKVDKTDNKSGSSSVNVSIIGTFVMSRLLLFDSCFLYPSRFQRKEEDHQRLVIPTPLCLPPSAQEDDLLNLLLCSTMCPM